MTYQPENLESEYTAFQRRLAFWGFTSCLTTQAGFGELRALGFSPDDCLNIESDMQAGFTRQDAIDAITEKESNQ